FHVVRARSHVNSVGKKSSIGSDQLRSRQGIIAVISARSIGLCPRDEKVGSVECDRRLFGAVWTVADLKWITRNRAARADELAEDVLVVVPDEQKVCDAEGHGCLVAEMAGGVGMEHGSVA